MIDRTLDPPGRPDNDQSREELRYSPEPNPPSREREFQDLRGYRYHVSPSDIATLREIGRFRTIDTNDLATYRYAGENDAMQADLDGLRAQGLIRVRTVWTTATGGPLNITVLTKAGRELAEKNQPTKDRQALYSGFVKAREVAHDAAIFRMYHAEALRIRRDGGQIRRVVLDYELKEKVYRPLAKLRARGNMETYGKRQAQVAASNGLKVVRGRILLPDLRIEYETANGVAVSVDLELATEHYRSGMMRGKAEAGFKLYAPGEAAARLAAAFDPEYVVEIFSF